MYWPPNLSSTHAICASFCNVFSGFGERTWCYLPENYKTLWHGHNRRHNAKSSRLNVRSSHWQQIESGAQLEGIKRWLVVLCPYVGRGEKLASLEVVINLSVNGSFKSQTLSQRRGELLPRREVWMLKLSLSGPVIYSETLPLEEHNGPCLRSSDPPDYSRLLSREMPIGFFFCCTINKMPSFEQKRHFSPTW